MAQNERGGANRGFWSMFPLTRVPFWYRFFEPQPFCSFAASPHTNGVLASDLAWLRCMRFSPVGTHRWFSSDGSYAKSPLVSVSWELRESTFEPQSKLG